MTRLNTMEYIGKIYKTNTSGDCFIIDMKSAQDITVMFYDGYCTKVLKGNLDKGKVKNPFDANNLVKGVGYYDGSMFGKSEEAMKIKNLWYNMLQRCYSDKFHEKQKTYVDVIVCEDWLTYSNFERDIVLMKNFDLFLKEGWELDKDLIWLGSKKYSNDNCCFLPRELNSKFSNVTQLFETDRGVSLLPHGTYRVNVAGVRGESSHVGCYKTKEEAVFVFRKHKSKVLLESLRKYDGIIDERVITSITNYLKSFKN